MPSLSAQRTADANYIRQYRIRKEVEKINSAPLPEAKETRDKFMLQKTRTDVLVAAAIRRVTELES
jgi:hypothetical protein